MEACVYWKPQLHIVLPFLISCGTIFSLAMGNSIYIHVLQLYNYFFFHQNTSPSAGVATLIKQKKSFSVIWELNWGGKKYGLMRGKYSNLTTSKTNQQSLPAITIIHTKPAIQLINKPLRQGIGIYTCTCTGVYVYVHKYIQYQSGAMYKANSCAYSCKLIV